MGTAVWLAGAWGHVYAPGTQFASLCARGPNDVPMEGAGTLALTGDMKKMRSRFVRGVRLVGYGVSLALGVGIPIPILDEDVLRRTTVRDRDIFATVIDYGKDYPERNGKTLGRVSYEELKSGEINLGGVRVETGSMSSYAMAQEISQILKDEISRGEFLLSPPMRSFPPDQSMKSLEIRGRNS